MIKNTYKCHNANILSAYSDNAAVITGHKITNFYPALPRQEYQEKTEDCHIVIKVETHNHPTAIEPLSGAATGAGGEIRDEAATGSGAKTKAGMAGFAVSNLNIPDLKHAWEDKSRYPDNIATALDIMLRGPIGAANFNNEFGRPNLCGFFRSLEHKVDTTTSLGYHKPIMIAGGMGKIKTRHVTKKTTGSGSKLIVLGGPAMLIGLGGGAASSVTAGSLSSQLDYASVQRHNPEMQRRCQEVIDQCWQLDENNPIAFIHDVGAGGIANALSELIHDNNAGGKIDLDKVICADSSMSSKEIWCNESQERYALAIAPELLDKFATICERERCPYAIVGELTENKHLQLTDNRHNKAEKTVDIPMDLLFGSKQKLIKDIQSPVHTPPQKLHIKDSLTDLANKVLQLPVVASKSF